MLHTLNQAHESEEDPNQKNRPQLARQTAIASHLKTAKITVVMASTSLRWRRAMFVVAIGDKGVVVSRFAHELTHYCGQGTPRSFSRWSAAAASVGRPSQASRQDSCSTFRALAGSSN